MERRLGPGPEERPRSDLVTGPVSEAPPHLAHGPSVDPIGTSSERRRDGDPGKGSRN